jgi:transglutaminase-like putative cysteine protease
MKDFAVYLRSTEVIDYTDELVMTQAKILAGDLEKDDAIAKACFLFVRDEIRHSGDAKEEVVTCRASEVLKKKTGWCYAKSHLLAALLRANGIPAGLTYQRLSCSEYEPGIYCLHGLNWVYLEKYGWYRIDARGNKKGVDAQFTPPHEKLAFIPAEDEYDLLQNFPDPLPEVVQALRTNHSYEEMVRNFPDVRGR